MNDCALYYITSLVPRLLPAFQLFLRATLKSWDQGAWGRGCYVHYSVVFFLCSSITLCVCVCVCVYTVHCRLCCDEGPVCGVWVLQWNWPVQFSGHWTLRTSQKVQCQETYNSSKLLMTVFTFSPGPGWGKHSTFKQCADPIPVYSIQTMYMCMRDNRCWKLEAILHNFW